MPNPRQPVAKARVSGADTKNPKRHQGRSDPKVGPIGLPPAYLSLAGKQAWGLFTKELPWLGASDRAILALAADLRATIQGDGAAPATMDERREYRLILGKLAASPTDRSKVVAPESEGDDDPAQKYLN